MPSDGTFYALAAGSDGARVAVYVGTSGGTATAGARGNVAIAATADNIVLGAGVYRLTTRLPNQWMYLPVVLRMNPR